MEPGTRPGLWECDLKEEEEHGRSCTDADVLVLLGLATNYMKGLAVLFLGSCLVVNVNPFVSFVFTQKAKLS